MTIKDIAKESGYAISTVSRALNNHPDVSAKAKEKIIAIVESHGFVPNNNARQLKQQVSTNIAIVVKGTSNMLFSIIIEHMQSMISEKGYSAVLYYLDEDANEVEEAVRICNEGKPLGIVFLGGNTANFENGFEKINVPAVLTTNIASNLKFKNLSSVSIDDTKSAFDAVNYLINEGHTEIGILGGNYDISDVNRLRFNGCRKSFFANNMKFNEVLQYQKARFSYKSAYKNMCSLLEKQKDLTAVFAMSDVMAIGAMRAIRDKGLRVPEDISVVGFDGIELGAYYSPKLTTIKQPEYELAKTSVDIIIEAIINSKVEPKNILVSSEIIKGESVCRKSH